MWIAILVVLVVVAFWMTRVNARYEAREKHAEAGPDARVEALWEAFGAPDAHTEDDVARLLAEVKPDALRDKHAVIVLAIMAARTGHVDVLEALAQRARSLDAGCGETAALGVLAAAYNGDLALARARHAHSQAVMAGCASCSAAGDARILMQEVALALDALQSGALPIRGAAPVDSAGPVDEAPQDDPRAHLHGPLHPTS